MPASPAVRWCVFGRRRTRRPARRPRVVAAVPLLALAGVDVAAGLDDPQLGQAERLGHHVDEALDSTVTSTPVPASSGRSENASMPSTMSGKAVTTSRSAKVNTVSRCMAARRLGMPATTTRSAAPVEQRLGHLGDGLAGGALAHADQHDAVAGGHDVAALEGGEPPVDLGVAPPGGGAGQVGVEPVQRLHEQRLVVAGRPVQRVEGDAAVDPAGGVAGVERVGQGRHQVVPGPRVIAGQGDVAGPQVVGQVGGGQAADDELEAGRRARRGTTGSRRPARCPTSLATILRSSSHARPRAGRAPRPASRAARRPRRPGRAGWRRTRGGPPGPGRPTSRRRTAARRSWSGSAVGGRGRASRPAPCGAGRPRSGRRGRGRGVSDMAVSLGWWSIGSDCTDPAGDRAMTPMTAPITETARITSSPGEKRRPCSRRAITNRMLPGA